MQNNSYSPAAAAFTGIIELIILVVFIVGLWKMFVKAGKPGWGALIPIYNGYLLVKIANRPGWWVLLYLIPIVNIVISLIVALDLAKAFNKSAAFGVVLLWLFSGIGYLVLGFGSATYGGETGQSNAPQQVPPAPNQPQVAPAAQTPPATPPQQTN